MVDNYSMTTSWRGFMKELMKILIMSLKCSSWIIAKKFDGIRENLFGGGTERLHLNPFVINLSNVLNQDNREMLVADESTCSPNPSFQSKNRIPMHLLNQNWIAQTWPHAERHHRRQPTNWSIWEYSCYDYYIVMRMNVSGGISYFMQLNRVRREPKVPCPPRSAISPALVQ